MTTLTDRIEHSALRQLHQYWVDKCGPRAMPAPKDIDPLELKFILGNLMLVDVTHDPLDFVMRLHGTNLVEKAGTDLTGKGTDAAPDPAITQIAQTDFTRVVESRQPVHRKFEHFSGDRPWQFEGLALPLSGDGDRVDRLLVAVFHKI